MLDELLERCFGFSRLDSAFSLADRLRRSWKVKSAGSQLMLRPGKGHEVDSPGLRDQSFY